MFPLKNSDSEKSTVVELFWNVKRMWNWKKVHDSTPFYGWLTVTFSMVNYVHAGCVTRLCGSGSLKYVCISLLIIISSFSLVFIYQVSLFIIYKNLFLNSFVPKNLLIK